MFPADPGNLRETPGCMGCHATLDPLADFFAVWGEGDNLYNTPGQQIQTTFGGKSGKHLADLAGIIQADTAPYTGGGTRRNQGGARAFALSEQARNRMVKFDDQGNGQTSKFATEGPGKFSLELTNDLRVDRLVPHRRLEADMLGNFFMPLDERTKYKGSLIGAGAGIQLNGKSASIALKYLSAMEGKVSILGEDKIVSQPGLLSLCGHVNACRGRYPCNAPDSKKAAIFA